MLHAPSIAAFTGLYSLCQFSPPTSKAQYWRAFLVCHRAHFILSYKTWSLSCGSLTPRWLLKTAPHFVSLASLGEGCASLPTPRQHKTGGASRKVQGIPSMFSVVPSGRWRSWSSVVLFVASLLCYLYRACSYLEGTAKQAGHKPHSKPDATGHKSSCWPQYVSGVPACHVVKGKQDNNDQT